MEQIQISKYESLWRIDGVHIVMKLRYATKSIMGMNENDKQYVMDLWWWLTYDSNGILNNSNSIVFA